MSFRFWRRVRLFPGVTLDLSKATASVSFGPPGAKVTLSPRGNRATAGIPGTGLFYTVKAPSGRGASRTQPAPPPVADRLDLGFFARLFAPADEEAFVDGLRLLHEGDEAGALGRLEAGADHPDAAWMAGMLRLKREAFDAAERHFRTALAAGPDLGALFAKYRLDTVVDLPVTDEVTAHLRPRPRGTRLALAELHQARGDETAALDELEAILTETPDDVVALAALCELLLANASDARAAPDAIVRMTAGIGNETAVHAAILLYKARALRRLGMDEIAVKTLTTAWRRKKDRPAELLRQIRYERAIAYRDIGRASRSRRELEAIYAEAPDFADVAERVGAAPGARTP